jgi:predicted nucleic acid-binding Zn ribbon protein
MDVRKCLECEHPIQGRKDKKFCSDACRNAYHNRTKADATQYIRTVNARLAKNRRILEELNTKGKTKKHRDQLLKLGFDFDYLTHFYVTRSGDRYHFCYEQGYLELGEGFLLLVKRDSDKE